MLLAYELLLVQHAYVVDGACGINDREAVAVLFVERQARGCRRQNAASLPSERICVVVVILLECCDSMAAAVFDD